jgi:23S rRNA pseudouridine1911/1915/1917 synthase
LVIVAKTDYAELPDRTRVPILYEDRAILALDKPPGWVLGPDDEERLRHNLHLALLDGIERGAFWARSRNLKFLRFVHRLDGPTSGVLLFAKSLGGIRPYSELFADRAVEKVYFAVTDGVPKESAWTCQLPLGPTPEAYGRHQVDPENGKPAETGFQLLATDGKRSLIEARPHTGRTHQIRLHLLAAGCPVVGDELYGRSDRLGLGLRSIRLAFRDPFSGKPICIEAPVEAWCERFGFRPEPSEPAESPAA